jgi:SulP family sulfate permease
MTVTLILTIIIPLQFAVLVGVGMATLLFVIRQSNDLVVKQVLIEDQGRREVDPPEEVGPHEVLVIQPYGSLFFASASVFEDRLPTVTDESRGSVVIVRLRGRTDLGSTLTETLNRYSEALKSSGSKLVLISDSDSVRTQLAVTGVTASIGVDNIYESDEWMGATLRRAHADALEWVGAHAN